MLVCFHFSYPTMYWVPHGGAPVEYTGEMDLESMSDFLRKSATKITAEQFARVTLQPDDAEQVHTMHFCCLRACFVTCYFVTSALSPMLSPSPSLPYFHPMYARSCGTGVGLCGKIVQNSRSGFSGCRVCRSRTYISMRA